jgi:hypothetical protein
MKLAIVGSRSFNDVKLLHEILDKHKDAITLVISGGAVGADLLGEEWAKKHNIPVKIFYPDWKKHGKSAGMIRNKLIIEECDRCIAFWDGKSNGTKNSISICKKLNKPFKIINYETIYRGNTI